MLSSLNFEQYLWILRLNSVKPCYGSEQFVCFIVIKIQINTRILSLVFYGSETWSHTKREGDSLGGDCGQGAEENIWV